MTKVVIVDIFQETCCSQTASADLWLDSYYVHVLSVDPSR
ncbi:unnamed protein product [Penicillium roqueforti FM164]|uniref:Genomic scaffold, ProqFM164S02 n=1 Tax=Penicillium roqueforti (strain FM164) TaxID=1365484 RepID=W6Q9W8_PENRF|nr:unnamed protein product [Penicillium roqueforti FM164]